MNSGMRSASLPMPAASLNLRSTFRMSPPCLRMSSAVQLVPKTPLHFFDHAFIAAGDIQNGKGDEQAVPAGVDEGCGCLEGAAQAGLALVAEGILLAAHAQDLGGDGVASGMIGAHGGGGVGDADALDRARFVGRHGLAFDRGYTGDAIGLPVDAVPAPRMRPCGVPLPISWTRLMAPLLSPNGITPASIATAIAVPVSMVSRP